jgi:hypothetical protein
MGNTIIIEGHGARGWIIMAHPSYIHSFSQQLSMFFLQTSIKTWALVNY